MEVNEYMLDSVKNYYKQQFYHAKAAESEAVPAIRSNSQQMSMNPNSPRRAITTPSSRGGQGGDGNLGSGPAYPYLPYQQQQLHQQGNNNLSLAAAGGGLAGQNAFAALWGSAGGPGSAGLEAIGGDSGGQSAVGLSAAAILAQAAFDPSSFGAPTMADSRAGAIGQGGEDAAAAAATAFMSAAFSPQGRSGSSAPHQLPPHLVQALAYSGWPSGGYHGQSAPNSAGRDGGGAPGISSLISPGTNSFGRSSLLKNEEPRFHDAASSAVALGLEFGQASSAAAAAAAVAGMNGDDVVRRYRDYSCVPDDDLPSGGSGTASSSGKGGASGKNFPRKLHEILSRDDVADVISWAPHGRSWRVLKPKAFEERVIPQYFRHGKYNSFTRQVNGWGFRRITQGPDHNSYYHEFFLRGLPHLCKKMRRLTASGLARSEACSTIEPDFYKIAKVSPLPTSNGNGKENPNLVSPQGKEKPRDTPVSKLKSGAGAMPSPHLSPSRSPGRLSKEESVGSRRSSVSSGAAIPQVRAPGGFEGLHLLSAGGMQQQHGTPLANARSLVARADTPRIDAPAGKQQSPHTTTNSNTTSNGPAAWKWSGMGSNSGCRAAGASFSPQESALAVGQQLQLANRGSAGNGVISSVNSNTGAAFQSQENSFNPATAYINSIQQLLQSQGQPQAAAATAANGQTQQHNHHQPYGPLPASNTGWGGGGGASSISYEGNSLERAGAGSSLSGNNDGAPAPVGNCSNTYAQLLSALQARQGQSQGDATASLLGAAQQLQQGQGQNHHAQLMWGSNGESVSAYNQILNQQFTPWPQIQQPPARVGGGNGSGSGSPSSALSTIQQQLLSSLSAADGGGGGQNGFGTSGYTGSHGMGIGNPLTIDSCGVGGGTGASFSNGYASILAGALSAAGNPQQQHSDAASIGGNQYGLTESHTSTAGGAVGGGSRTGVGGDANAWLRSVAENARRQL